MIDFLLGVPGKLKAISDALTAGLDAAVSTRATPADISPLYSKYSSVVWFTSGTSWVVPPGVTKIRVWAIGAGGGGGAANYATRITGGGGGSLSCKEFTVTPGSTLTFSIGVGGNGTIYGGAAGSNGGNTTVTYGGVTITAGGGSLGASGTSTAAVSGGAGGTASGGTLNVTGGSAVSVAATATAYAFVGGGGAAATIFGTPPSSTITPTGTASNTLVLGGASVLFNQTRAATGALTDGLGVTGGAGIGTGTTNTNGGYAIDSVTYSYGSSATYPENGKTPSGFNFNGPFQLAGSGGGAGWNNWPGGYGGPGAGGGAAIFTASSSNPYGFGGIFGGGGGAFISTAGAACTGGAGGIGGGGGAAGGVATPTAGGKGGVGAVIVEY